MVKDGEKLNWQAHFYKYLHVIGSLTFNHPRFNVNTCTYLNEVSFLFLSSSVGVVGIASVFCEKCTTPC